MSADDHPSLNDIFDQETLEELGSPEKWNSYSDADPVVAIDYSQFKNPDLDLWTNKATNAAADLNPSLPFEDLVEETESKLREVIEEFHHNFSQYKSQNPVFVSEDVLEEVGDKKVGYLKIQGDPRLYPVTVRSFEEFEERIDDIDIFDAQDIKDSGFKDTDREEAREEYRKRMKDSALRNDFVLPTYWNQTGLPQQLNTSLITGEDSLVWDLESEEAFEPDQRSDTDITEIELDDGYAVQIDVSDYGSPEMNVSIDEGALVICADDDEIYRSGYVEGGFTEVKEEKFNDLTGSYVVEVV